MTSAEHPGGRTAIGGRATGEGTGRYRGRFMGRVSEDYFLETRGWWVSSIGIGTYLGDPCEEDDTAYRDAVAATVRAGGNVIDTAINYRLQRSERSVGAALGILRDEGYGRDEIVIATKGGFLPFDGEVPRSPADWFRSALLEPGIASPTTWWPTAT